MRTLLYKGFKILEVAKGDVRIFNADSVSGYRAKDLLDESTEWDAETVEEAMDWIRTN